MEVKMDRTNKLKTAPSRILMKPTADLVSRCLSKALRNTTIISVISLRKGKLQTKYQVFLVYKQEIQKLT